METIASVGTAAQSSTSTECVPTTDALDVAPTVPIADSQDDGAVPAVRPDRTSLMETIASVATAAESSTSKEYVPEIDADALDFAPAVVIAAAQADGAGPAVRHERIRCDSTFLTSADIAVREQQAQQRISELASVSATERKTKCLASECSAPSSSTTYTILDLDVVNSLLEVAVCRVCSGALTIERDTREYGIAVKLKVLCSNCGELRWQWSSRRVAGSANCNPFEINVLAARAVQSSGNGQTALNDIFSAIGVSHRGMHTKTYQNYLKSKLNPAATRACTENLKKCAATAKELYTKLNFGNPGNIAVCFDGTWHTRGHTSHIGVATVIELFSGYVLDYVVLSNFCLGCECGPKPDSPGYAEWKATHSCQKNTSCKAGQMEVEAAKVLFQRSLSLHGLRYTTMLCDGDSRSFNAIEEAKVYGFIPVTKEDCTNHVQKRMGSAL